MTFSIAARCARTGMLGVAVTSSSICVASRCTHGAAGIGAVQTQNITDPDLGIEILALCAQGHSPEQAINSIVLENENIQWRQLGVVDTQGRTACFSGAYTLGVHAAVQGKACVALGNLLDNTGIPAAMVEAFEMSGGHLAERLLLALTAGLNAGGEAGPIHSAGVKVYDAQRWPVVDLRVDWNPNPDEAISQLMSIWGAYKPQLDAYVTRALNPAESESYGVPGDE